MKQYVFVTVLCLVFVAAPSGADVITLDDLSAWHEDFSGVQAWQARPDWLPNPDPGASVALEGACIQFKVNAGTGMKWSRAITLNSRNQTEDRFGAKRM